MATPLPTRRVRADEGWCDAPQSQRYNRHVRRPAAVGHEALVRADALYDVLAVTDHNQSPRVRGAGSAIFIHVARDDHAPTAGCIAFPAAVWRRRQVPIGPYLVGVEPRAVR
jgi:L,D-peptidoglycan transpeptidase YkuD (ErfK/YbiS/YcfS/YnhG family)